MLVRVLFCTDGEISEITIQDEAGQELQRLIPGRDGSAVSARLEPGPLPRRDDAGRGRLYPSAERIRPRGIRPVLVRRRAAPSDGRSGRLRARAAGRSPPGSRAVWNSR